MQTIWSKFKENVLYAIPTYIFVLCYWPSYYNGGQWFHVTKDFLVTVNGEGGVDMLYFYKEGKAFVRRIDANGVPNEFFKGITLYKAVMYREVTIEIFRKVMELDPDNE